MKPVQVYSGIAELADARASPHAGSIPVGTTTILLYNAVPRSSTHCTASIATSHRKVGLYAMPLI